MKRFAARLSISVICVFVGSVLNSEAQDEPLKLEPMKQEYVKKKESVRLQVENAKRALKKNSARLSQLKVTDQKKNELEKHLDSVSQTIEAKEKQVHPGDDPTHTSSKEAYDLIHKQREKMNLPSGSQPLSWPEK